MRYITFLYNNWFLSNWAKIAELLFTGRVLFRVSVYEKIYYVILKISLLGVRSLSGKFSQVKRENTIG